MDQAKHRSVQLRSGFAALTAFFLASIHICGHASAADGYRVGVASVDITPDYPVLLNGFLARQEPSLGASQPIHAKALAISEGEASPLVLITVDALGIPRELREEVCRRLDQIGLRPERIAVTATHTHSAPIINHCAPNILGRDFSPSRGPGVRARCQAR